MAKTAGRKVQPTAGQLWLSRPPYLLIAQISQVLEDEAGGRKIGYWLLDDDGSPLIDLVWTQLDATWWSSFAPMIRRNG